jgi:DNA protecting protein DprA
MIDTKLSFSTLRLRREEAVSSAFSALFRGVPGAADTLYLRGRPGAAEALVELLPERGLAVVGTRRAQARALEQVRSVLRGLQGSRLVVLSGLARGIDTAAHEAALEAGLPTIAVLAGGVEHVYPRENEALAERIMSAGGLLVSEFAPEQSPRPGMFLKRNRLIAAWAQATWVAQASHRSGALNTAAWARQCDREVFSTPCFPGDPSLAGNQRLIDELHARPLWDARSLGQVWIELAARSGLVSARKECANRDPLCEAVKALTTQSGGADASALLDWAIERGWSVVEFYSSLEARIKSGEILEKNGGFSLADTAASELRKPDEVSGA